jgi:rhodanese-related sulfurtransferase
VVHDALDEYTVLDIRTGDKYGPGTPNPNGVVDFEDGHIPGAHMVALADVVNWVEENGLDEGSDKYLVVCYTGQSAGHAVLALNLLGYEEPEDYDPSLITFMDKEGLR